MKLICMFVTTQYIAQTKKKKSKIEILKLNYRQS